MACNRLGGFTHDPWEQPSRGKSLGWTQWMNEKVELLRYYAMNRAQQVPKSYTKHHTRECWNGKCHDVAMSDFSLVWLGIRPTPSLVFVDRICWQRPLTATALSHSWLSTRSRSAMRIKMNEWESDKVVTCALFITMAPHEAMLCCP